MKIDNSIEFDEIKEGRILTIQDLENALNNAGFKTKFKITELPKPEPDESEYCEWKLDEKGYWNTACGQIYKIYKSNCRVCACGKPIK